MHTVVCDDLVGQISSMHRVLLAVEEMKATLKSDTSIELCFWLFCNLSSDCANEEELFDELKTKGGSCNVDWNQYGANDCNLCI